jgi:hypothetical protein
VEEKSAGNYLGGITVPKMPVLYIAPDKAGFKVVLLPGNGSITDKTTFALTTAHQGMFLGV